MPLQKQIVTLPLALGVDTKTDSKQVAVGKLLALENGVFGTLKQLRKRNGYTALPQRVMTTSGYSALDSAFALTSYRDELIMTGQSTTSIEERLYSYAEGSEQWVDKGALTTCAASVNNISRSSVARTGVDGATTETGLQVYAWEEAGSVRYAVRDTTSGQLVVASGLVSTTAYKPRVMPFTGGAVIYYIRDDGVLYVRSLLSSLGASLTPAVALTGSIPGAADTLSLTPANRCYDVTTYGSQLLLAFSNDAGSVTVRRYDYSSATISVRSQVAAFLSAPTVIAIVTDEKFENVVLAVVAGQNIESQFTDALLLNAFGGVTIVSTCSAGETWLQLGMVSVPDTSPVIRLRLWASLKDNATNRLKTSAITLDQTGYPFITRTILHAGLASKPFFYNKGSFVVAVYVSKTTGAPANSGLQNQFVVLSESANDGVMPVARLLYGSAAGLPSTSGDGAPNLPNAYIGAGDLIRVAALESVVDEAPVGEVQTVAGVVGVELDFSRSPLVDNRSELGGSLILGGGALTQYDGVGPVELGFWLWPDEVTVTLGAGGSLSAGEYQWVATYEWTDNQGLVHRSAPSLPVRLTATASQQASVVVSTLSLTRKQARSPVRIVLYRTLANGTNFYRASSLAAPTENNPSVATVSLTDGLDDATLATRPLLYTTGGVVENIPPGAVDGVVVHRGRLWSIDAANKLRLWFSRQVQTGAPVEFSDALYLDVDARGGDVVGLASLDDKLIVFKRGQIFFVAGQGPDATGSLNDFSDAVLVTTDVGCLDARSIVTTPAGLMFQTSKGIYLINRSLEVSYIGADVEAYNGATVESSQLITTTNQVRFVLSTGVALVYDYLVGQWSVFTNHPAVDSVVWLDCFCWLRSDGVAMREDPTRHDDDGRFVPLRFTTGWIGFDGNGGPYTAAAGGRGPASLQSFQRARRLLILGEYQGAHRLRVQVGFDYNDAPAQDVTITPAEPDTYGEGPTYGDETPYGGEWQLYQWRVDLARQKCQAVQVTITDEREGGAVSSEGVRLSALAFELGIKPGTTRVPMTQVVG